MPIKKLKVVSLFCGCGGSDLGMIGGFQYLNQNYPKLPFEIVYALDFDRWAVDTYNKNFSHPAVCEDILKVDFNSLPDADIMIGGFPCQSFSTVNPTKDTNDARANLYKQIVRFLQIKRPKYFICENVKGLLTLQKGSIIQKITSEFKAVGYNVQYKLMKAVEFGIPQRRERVFIIGYRNDIEYNYRFPTSINTEHNAVPLSSVIDKLEIEEKKYYFSERAVQGMKNAKNNMKRGLWQDLNGPCLTITSHLSKTSINSRDPLLLVKPSEELYRRFTPREAARIQSFPDSFELNNSEAKSYKQIGNAIPPVLMWHIANSLAESIHTAKFINPIKKVKSSDVLEIDFEAIIHNHPTGIVNQNVNNDDIILDYSKNLLVSLVKADNMEQYLDQSAKIYYTGKKFPSTVALNKLYYFMPYIKGKGIKDLYFIKIARVGTRKEGQPDNDPNDFRLVFEIEFVKQLFEDYKKVHLDIWQTFKDTTLGNLVDN